jgi:hypothetical protein
MQMDVKYKAVKQIRCMTRVITALRFPINKTVSSRCDPKPGSLTGDAVQFSVGRRLGSWLLACPSSRSFWDRFTQADFTGVMPSKDVFTGLSICRGMPELLFGV